jgi:Bacterial Ig-like domain (group 2)
MTNCASNLLRASILGATLLTLTSCGGGGGGAGTSASPPTTYSVSATVSGLTGSGLTVSFNGGTPVPLSSNGTVTLASRLVNGASYSVTVVASPVNPSETCNVSGGSGMVAGSNVNLPITCTTANTPQASTQVQADPTIPDSITSTVAMVVTASGQGALGSWIQINVNTTTGDTPALALDSGGHLVLAAMASSNQTAFTADSTAVAMVRLALFDLSTTMSGGNIDAAIRAAAAYAQLLSQINTDLASGTRPLSDSKVALDVLTVVSQVAPTVIVTASADRRSAKSVTNQTVSTNPFTVISGGGSKAGPGVQVQLYQQGPGTAQIQVVNNMAIPWSVSSTYANGNQLVAAMLVAAGSSPNIASANSPFNLTLTQNGDTYNQIAVDNGAAVVSGMGKLYNKAFNTPCFSSIALPLLKAQMAPYEQQGTNITLSQVVNALPQALTTTTVTSVLKSCAPAIIQYLGIQTVLLYQGVYVYYADLIAGILASPVAAIAAVVLYGASIIVEDEEATQYQDQTYQDLVCAALDFTIHSCVAALTFSPPTVVLAPSATTTVSVLGWADAGATQSTPLPGDIQVSAVESSTIASVAYQSGTATVTAGTLDTIPAPQSQSTMTFTASDPATATQSTVPLAVTVAVPTIVPSISGAIVVPTTDQTLTATLQGPAGMVLPGGITWTPDQSSATIIPVSTTGNTGTWTIPANAAPDKITISARDPSGDKYGPVTITVFAQIGTTTSVDPNPGSLPVTGGLVSLTASVAPVQAAPAGVPPPSGTVTYSDQNGVLCLAQPLSQPCNAQILVAPDTITAAYSGDLNYAASSGQTTVTLSPLILSISPSAPTVIVGSTMTLSVSATDTSGNLVTTPPNLQWTSSDSSLATVSAALVTGIAVGSTTITVTDPASGATAAVTVIIVGAKFALNPSGVSVTFGLADLGIGGYSQISGPSSESQNCASPCAQFGANGGTYSGTLSVTDVWMYGLPGYPNITTASNLLGSITFTGGTNPSMTATNNWAVTSTTGAFDANFGGTFLFTTGSAFTVTASCTSSWVAVDTTFCGGNLAASIVISQVGGAQIQPVISTGSAQFILPAPGQYRLTWQTLGGNGGGCCLTEAGSGATPSGSASVTISVVFQPSG